MKICAKTIMLVPVFSLLLCLFQLINRKQTKKKIRNFSIVRLVSKISHPRLAARLIENENNSK